MKEKGIYLLLFIWLCFGYVLDIDFTQIWGCLAFEFADLTKHKIAIASTSLFLFTSSLRIEEQRVKASIAIVELLSWFTLMLILKGGYAIGIGGTPDPIYVLYDFTGLLLRVWLISKLIGLDNLLANRPMRILAMLMTAFVGMVIKIEFFSIPLIEFY